MIYQEGKEKGEEKVILADAGIAGLVAIIVAAVIAITIRQRYNLKHPPPTLEEKTAQLERELGMREEEE